MMRRNTGPPDRCEGASYGSAVGSLSGRARSARPLRGSAVACRSFDTCFPLPGCFAARHLARTLAEQGSSASAADVAYARLAQSYFAEQFRANPVYATATGVHTYDGELGSYEEGDYAAQIARDHRYLDGLTALDATPCRRASTSTAGCSTTRCATICCSTRRCSCGAGSPTTTCRRPAAASSCYLAQLRAADRAPARRDLARRADPALCSTRPAKT